MAKALSNGLAVLPVVASAVLLLSAVASYAVALRLNASILNLIVPYPSDLLVKQPQRGVFAAGLGASACFSTAVILLRYIQTETCFPTDCSTTNQVSLATGGAMVLGQATVAAFSLEESFVAHCCFACIYFGGCCLYMITQTQITRVTRPLHSRSWFKLRVVLSAMAVLCPCAFVCGRMLAPAGTRGYYIPQVAEWILGFITVIFTATLAVDFKGITVCLFPVADAANTREKENGSDTSDACKFSRNTEPDPSNCF